jgi:hypothetical protein
LPQAKAGLSGRSIQTAVVCCVCAATAVFFSAAALHFVFFLFLAAPLGFNKPPWLRNDAKAMKNKRATLILAPDNVYFFFC